MFTNGSSDSFGLFNFSLNGTDFSADLDILFKPEPVLLALYVPTILISLFANILLIVVTVLCHYTKNVTNMYLVNLSVADLLVTVVCMPIQLSKAVTLVWFYGEAVCKTVNYMQGVAVSASILTIAMMSLDRWLSITPEPRLRPPGRRQAMIIIVILWGASMLIFTPALMVATVETESVPVIIKNGKNITIITRNVNFCTEMWSGPETKKRFGIFSFTLVYAIPGTITILSYAFMGRTLCSIRPPFDFDEGAVSMQQGIQRIRERKRIAWTLFILAMIFALCWMPYNVMQLLLDLNEVTASELSNILPYALFAGHLNSAINPVVYCIMTKNFQRSAQKLLCKREVCRRVQRYTWRCTQRPEGSSSDYELYHGPHKKCYLQMQTYRYNGHTFETVPRQGNVPAGAPQSSRGYPEARTRATQFTQTRSSRRTAPVHTLSVEMLHRHCQINNTR